MSKTRSKIMPIYFFSEHIKRKKVIKSHAKHTLYKIRKLYTVGMLQCVSAILFSHLACSFCKHCCIISMLRMHLPTSSAI